MKTSSSGKVRDIYSVSDKELLIVSTDRVSAFDTILPVMVPKKGIVLNQLSAFWFGLTEHLVKNHMISVYKTDMPWEFQTNIFNDRCMLVKKLTMLPIECIVRGYITGSGWKSYQESGSICGIRMPQGLLESEKLPEPIYTPTTKAAEGKHDEPISYKDTISLLGNEALAKKVRDISLELYRKCAGYAKRKGIIIADTKFEFGIDDSGELYLADELFTPDSSRFWDVATYHVGKRQDSYDKQIIRDYLEKVAKWDKNSAVPELPQALIRETSKRYVAILERLSGIKI